MKQIFKFVSGLVSIYVFLLSLWSLSFCLAVNEWCALSVRMSVSSVTNLIVSFFSEPSGMPRIRLLLRLTLDSKSSHFAANFPCWWRRKAAIFPSCSSEVVLSTSSFILVSSLAKALLLSLATSVCSCLSLRSSAYITESYSPAACILLGVVPDVVMVLLVFVCSFLLSLPFFFSISHRLLSLSNVNELSWISAPKVVLKSYF